MKLIRRWRQRWEWWWSQEEIWYTKLNYPTRVIFLGVVWFLREAKSKWGLCWVCFIMFPPFSVQDVFTYLEFFFLSFFSLNLWVMKELMLEIPLQIEKKRLSWVKLEGTCIYLLTNLLYKAFLLVCWSLLYKFCSFFHIFINFLDTL